MSELDRLKAIAATVDPDQLLVDAIAIINAYPGRPEIAMATAMTAVTLLFSRLQDEFRDECLERSIATLRSTNWSEWQGCVDWPEGSEDGSVH